MPGEEEDRVGSSALLAASASTAQQEQKPQQPATTTSSSSIAATLDKVKNQLQQQQQQQQQHQPSKNFLPAISKAGTTTTTSAQPQYSGFGNVPVINVNPSSGPTSGTLSVAGSGSAGDILHHASIEDDDDEEDADDEDDICGSKLELELQFAGLEKDGGVGGGGRRKVSGAHQTPGGAGGGSASTLDRVGGSTGGGATSVGGGGVGSIIGPGEQIPGEEELGEGDPEAVKAPPAPPEEVEPTFKEKFLFYTTAFFILLAVFSLFAFMFLVPFVIDPAFTTIFMKFDPEPAECETIAVNNGVGIKNCTWASCSEGCTRELFNCTQIHVKYRHKKRTNSTINTPQFQQLRQEQQYRAAQEYKRGASQSSAYTSYYSSYSKSMRSQHDPGASIQGVRWDAYPAFNHIYQSTNNNNINNNNNKISTSHYHFSSYNNNDDRKRNNNKRNSYYVGQETDSSNDSNNVKFLEPPFVVGPVRVVRKSRATNPADSSSSGDSNNNNNNADRNSVILNGNHKKKKRKLSPSSSVNSNNNNIINNVKNNVDVSSSSSSNLLGADSGVNPHSEPVLPWASALSRRNEPSSGKIFGKNVGGPDEDGYTRARLYTNVKGCGYPPNTNCTIFTRKYGIVGEKFPCYYSQVDHQLVVTSFNMDRVILDLVYSMAIPIPSFIISVIYLIFAYFRIYNMDTSSNPPPASSETANSSNPHDDNTSVHNNNIGNNNNSGGGEDGGGDDGGGSTGGDADRTGGETTSLSQDDKTRIIQRSTSRGLNALSDKLMPNSANKAAQPLIQMKDLAPSHPPQDGDLMLPRRNNRAPERNGPTNPQAKNKGDGLAESSGDGDESNGDDGNRIEDDVDVFRSKYLEPGVLPEKNNSLPPIELPKKY